MAKPEVLAKVDADLDRGHTHLATQRLNSLISADPYDLGLRARLAAVHRRTGNAAEAGRWGYLTEDVTPAELAAFAKAYHRSTADQLRALGLRGEAPRGLGPLAGARFADLTDRASSPTAPPQPLRPVPPRSARPVPPQSVPPAPWSPPAPRSAPEIPPSDRPPVPAARPKAQPASPKPPNEAAAGFFVLTMLVFAVFGVVTVIRWFL